MPLPPAKTSYCNRVVAWFEVADQERGRIERNIHDGAQQRLVSVAVQLKLARTLAVAGQPPDEKTLDALHDEVTAALHELRELARGIYPSLLTERGLIDALGAAARQSAFPTTIASTDKFDLPNDVESALYFFCLGAMQNAAKHAGSNAELTLSFQRHDDSLSVEISDNGIGFDDTITNRSRGLLNMSDRVRALGGDLSIESTLGDGTTISALVPLQRPVQDQFPLTR
ncbi:MAG: signal transduction histidine kinase [Acidimicrobiales bacterium]|jgi:signal transduction histidine kinase